MTVNPRTLPSDIDFRKLIVTCPNWGFLILAPTVDPTNETAKLSTGFRNLFHAFSVPSVFFHFLLKSRAFPFILITIKLDRFLAITFTILKLVTQFKNTSFAIRITPSWFCHKWTMPMFAFCCLLKIFTSCPLLGKNLTVRLFTITTTTFNNTNEFFFGFRIFFKDILIYRFIITRTTDTSSLTHSNIRNYIQKEQSIFNPYDFSFYV